MPILFVVFFATGMASPASGAILSISPVSVDVAGKIAPRPSFRVEIEPPDDGSLHFSFSDAPDVVEAGEDAGNFVRSLGAGFGPDRSDLEAGGLAAMPADTGPLPAGVVFWQASYNGKPFSGVRQSVVVDQAPVALGWSIRVKEARPTKKCRRRVAIAASIRYEDNPRSASEEVVARISLKRGSRVVGTARGLVNWGNDDLRAKACVKRAPLLASLKLVDKAGQSSWGSIKQLR